PRVDGKNGKPDLSGLWEADPTPHDELVAALGKEFFELQIDVPNVSKYAVNLLWNYKPAEDPTRPEAGALLKQRGESALKDLPSFGCPADERSVYLSHPAV